MIIWTLTTQSTIALIPSMLLSAALHEDCAVELPGIVFPLKIQLDLPELPLSKKAEVPLSSLQEPLLMP
jgi:hypothetical protein